MNIRFNAVKGVEANHQGPVVQSGVHAALSRRRSRVQIPSGPLGETRIPGIAEEVG